MEFKRIFYVEEEGWEECWKLYVSSFPKHEQRTLDNQKNVMKNEDFVCCGIWDKDIFVGIIFFWKTEAGAFVEHFAVKKELRGKSYGSKAMGDFCKSQKNVILEIDPPKDEISNRRRAFYERLGFKVNSYEYFNPGYDNNPYKMLLLTYPETIEKDQFDYFNEFMRKMSFKDEG